MAVGSFFSNLPTLFFFGGSSGFWTHNLFSLGFCDLVIFENLFGLTKRAPLGNRLFFLGLRQIQAWCLAQEVYVVVLQISFGDFFGDFSRDFLGFLTGF